MYASYMVPIFSLFVVMQMGDIEIQRIIYVLLYKEFHSELFWMEKSIFQQTFIFPLLLRLLERKVLYPNA